MSPPAAVGVVRPRRPASRRACTQRPARRAPGTGARSRRSRAGRRCLGNIARASSRTRAAVASREMVSASSCTPASRGDLGGLRGGRVAGLARARRSRRANVASWMSRSARCATTATRFARRVSPVNTIRRPRPVRADDLLRRDATDRLAALEPAEVRARLTPSAPPAGVEASGPVVLDEGVAERRPAVADREGLDRVAVEAQRLVRPEFARCERVAEAAEDRLAARSSSPRAARAEDVQRPLRSRRSNVFSMPGSPSQWSGWQVGDEDGVDVGQADAARS